MASWAGVPLSGAWGTAMLTAIKHYFARRRLGPVVAVLPFALSRSFGNAEFYTLPQAQKTIATLKIKPALPQGFKSLGLSKEQISKIYSVQIDYRTKIADLKKHISDLDDKEKTEVFKVLTEDQRAKYLKTSEFRNR